MAITGAQRTFSFKERKQGKNIVAVMWEYQMFNFPSPGPAKIVKMNRG